MNDYHDRRLARRMEDPEFRKEFKKARAHVSQRRTRSPLTMLQRGAISEGHKRRQEGLAESCEMVPVAPFREQFQRLRERGEMNLSQLCTHMGWIIRLSDERCAAENRKPGSIRPHTTQAQWTLGMKRRPTACSEQEYVTYDVAMRLMDALGMDPHECGL